MLRKFLMLSLLIVAAIATLGSSCGGELPPIPPAPPGPICTPNRPTDCWRLSGGRWVYVPKPGPSPSCSPSPVPTPTPAPTPKPTCSDITCPPGTHCEMKGGTPTCVEDPPIPPSPPPPEKPVCVVEFKPVETGWSLLSCTPGCPGGAGVKCDCNGDGCSFDVKLGPNGTNCRGDSTSRYNGTRPNWKTCSCAASGDDVPCNEWPTSCEGGKVERSEYPPPPAYGHDCNAKSVWSATAGVDITPEADGFGAKVRFTKEGVFEICAARAGKPELKTCKKARVKF